MLILGIETSCDETAAAVVKDGRVILSNVIASQVAIHQKYGGVVPEIASRKHIERISDIVALALAEAGVRLDQLDGVAATYGPGLVGALLVGLSYAKGLACAIERPLLGVHHIEGHICANYLAADPAAPGDAPVRPPYVCLVASGGHTTLVHVRDYGDYAVLGQTRDDAAGEAYDKVARAIGLGYPGGPLIDKLARTGDAYAYAFPRAFLEEDSLDFSFSGVKSAVLNAVNSARMQGQALNQADIAASFQRVVVDVLTAKTMAACAQTGVTQVAAAGGVASNSALRAAMRIRCEGAGYGLHIPPAGYCTDNAAMIACSGYFQLKKGDVAALSLNAAPSLHL